MIYMQGIRAFYHEGPPEACGTCQTLKNVMLDSVFGAFFPTRLPLSYNFRFVVTILLLHNNRHAMQQSELIAQFCKRIAYKGPQNEQKLFFIKMFLFLCNTCVFTKKSWKIHAYDNLSFFATHLVKTWGHKNKLFTSWPFMSQD